MTDTPAAAKRPPGNPQKNRRAGMLAAAIETSFTVFRGLRDTAGELYRLGWQVIADRLVRHEVGTRDGTLFCGAEFSGKRERANVKARHLYILDIETSKQTGEVPPELEDVRRAIEARGWAAVIYSTWNHEPGAPRYRVVLLPGASIVFNGNVKAIEADADVTLGLADMIGLGGVVDRTKLCAESMYFLPRHGEGREFFAVNIDGEPISGDELEAARDTGRKLREDDDAYTQAATAPASGAKSNSVIAVFNSATPVSTLLEQYGYRRKPRSLVDWRSPFQQSESYATRVYDDRRFVTLSASDIAAGIGRKAAGGAAACGDAFDLFCAFEHKGNQRAAMRAAAKALGLDGKAPADDWSQFDGAGGDDDASKPADGAPVHPLARFVPALPSKLTQPKMILPGLIASGLVVIAGQHGVGKTTVLASIVVKVAGATVEGDPLAPRYGRHVVYISEDTDQFQRIMYAVAKAIPGAADVIRERVHLVEAVRLPVDKVVEVAAFYADHFTTEVDGARLPPLVVLDTRSAIIAVDDENDNAETSKIMAALKQRFAGLPVWIVGHVAKASFGRADAKSMSARGATALEGDAHQVIFIVIEENDERFLVRGKTRFEAAVASCRLVSHVAYEWGEDEFGAACEVPVRHVTIEPLTPEEDADRQAEAAAARKMAAEDAKAARLEDARRAILEWVIGEAQQGNRYDKEGVSNGTRRIIGNAAQRKAVIDDLLDKHDLEVVPWGTGERPSPRSKGYLRRKDWTAGNMGGVYDQPAEGEE